MHKISIHALRVEGDTAWAKKVTEAISISIHALRVEGDRIRHLSTKTFCDFYPRPPGGGRLTIPTEGEVKALLISIHALRVEGDQI